MQDSGDINNLKQKLETLEKENLSLRRKLDAIQNSEKARTTFEHNDLAALLPDAIVDLDTTGRIINANINTFNLLGLPNDYPMDGLQFTELIVPRDRQRITTDFIKRISGEKFQGREYSAIHTSGKEIPFIAYTSLMFHNNEIAGLRCLLLDNSMRKTTEEALLRLNQHLETTLQALPDIFIEISLDRRIIEFRSPDNMFLTYSEAEILNNNIETLFKGKAASILVQTIDTCIKHWERQRVELTVYKIDQELFFEAILSPNGQREDKTASLIILLRDITERKEAESNLIILNTILEAQKEATVDGILIVRKDGKIVNYNERFREIWDLEHQSDALIEEAALLKNVKTKLKDPDKFSALLKEISSHKTKTHNDDLILANDTILEYYTRLIKTQNDTLIGRIWYFRDVTEKRKEQQIQNKVSANVIELQSALLEITKADLTDKEKAIDLIIQKASALESVDRVGIWMLSPDKKTLHCTKLYDTRLNKFVKAGSLSEQDFPMYFDAIRNNRIVIAEHVDKNEITKALFEKELKKIGIKSLLDAPIRFDGNVIGLFGMTTMNKSKFWPVEELNFAASLADLVALVFERSERRNTEISLRDSEAKFRTLANVARTAIFIIQGEYFEYMNKAGEEILGLEGEEIATKKFWDVVHPDFVELIKQRGLARQRGEDVPSRYEFRVINKKLGPRWFDYSTQIIEYNGKPAILGTGFDITERKEAEEALIESEKRYRLMLQNAPEGILIADIETLRFRFVNPAICKILGYTEEELLSFDIRKIHPPEKFDYVLQEFEAQVRGEKVVAYNIPCLRKDGTVIYANFSTTCQLFDGVWCNVGFVQDTTEYKKAVEALQQSEQKYFDIVENANEAIFVLQNGEFKFHNSKALQFINLEEEEIADRSFMDFVHPDDRQKVLQNHTDRLNGKEVENVYEFRIVDKNLYIKWVLINAVLITWEGKPAILSFMTDISRRKTIEDALRNELNTNQSFAAISRELLSPNLSIEKMADKVLEIAKKLTHSKHGFVSYINQETKDNVVLSFCRESKNESSIEDTYLSFKMINNEYPGLIGHSLNIRSSFFTNNPANHVAAKGIPEQHIPITNFLSAPATFNTELLGEISVANAIGAYNDQHLEIIERLADLYAIALFRKKSENEVLAAKNKAEESDKLKTSFLENMSHEIRTPMNGIVGFAELLSDNTLGREQTLEYIKYIKNSSKVLLNLIDDIIDISKIEADQLKISKSNFELHSLLNELLFLFEEEKTVKGKTHVSIRQVLPTNSNKLEIYTDPYRLRQVFTNLLSNALKFTDEGNIDYGYRINKDNILFFVRDTGLGIPEDKKDVIFERFRQVHETPTKSFGGTGLGLPISKKLVELLGGKLWVESELNKGSEFKFEIPLISGIPETISETSGKENNEMYNWEKRKILLVEDEEVNIRLLEAVLARTKAELLLAKNGLEAVNQVSMNPDIDIILMDIQLPELNGYDATERIRLKHKTLPIIAQTAYAMADEKEKIMKSGFNDYIVKPINKEKLLATIQKHLREN